LAGAKRRAALSWYAEELHLESTASSMSRPSIGGRYHRCPRRRQAVMMAAGAVAPQVLLERELDAFLAPVLDVREADDACAAAPLRVPRHIREPDGCP
jgi:hypothetical protein